MSQSHHCGKMVKLRFAMSTQNCFNNSRMQKFLSSVIKPLTMASAALLFAATALIPLLVLPIGNNFLVDSKTAILFGVAFLVGLLWTLLTLARRSLQITLSPFILPLAVVALSTIVSIIFNQTTLPLAQLFGFGGVYLSFVVISLIAPSLIEEKHGKFFTYALVLSAILLSLTAGAEFFQAGPSHIFNVLLKTQFPSSPVFSLAGSPLIAAEILAMTLAACATHIFFYRKKANPLFVLGGAISVLGLGVNGYALFQAMKTSPLLLPYSATSSIALDVMKSGKNALIGVGPDNFLQTYLLLKPTWLNITTFWNLQFSQGSNLPLSVLVTLGLFGLAAWILLGGKMIQAAIKSSKEGKIIAAAVITGLIVELFLPINPVVLLIQALGLVFWTATEKGRLKDIQLHAFTVQVTKSGADVQRVPKHSNLMVYLMTSVSAILLGLSLWFWVGPTFLGQYFMFRATTATLKNNAVDTYNFQQKAIQFNPYLASYRVSYSNTNMAIALALSQSQQASDAEKSQVVTLVQQAIQEAKIATVLEPANSTNWLNLARIYSNLIGSADNADNFTVQAYSQAVALAPTDPILNLEAGGVLYRLKGYNQAVQVFEKTANLKPDWPNAFYNLANAYRLNNEAPQAAAAYQQTLSLLQAQGKGEGDDYKKVQAELADLQKGAAQSQTNATPAVTPEVKPAVTPKKKAAVTPSSTPSSLLAPTAASSTQFTTEGGLPLPSGSPTP